MRLNPCDHFFGMLCYEVTENKEDLRRSLFCTSRCMKSRVVWVVAVPSRNSNFSRFLILMAEYHCQAKTLAGGCQHQRMPQRGIVLYPVTVFHHRRFVGSVDSAVIVLGFLRDQGIDLLHPALHVIGLFCFNAWRVGHCGL